MKSDIHRFRCRGITLIELLAVMLIIVIIGSVSIPAFISIGRGRGRRYTVSTVFTHLSLARQQAITRRRKVNFRYTSGGPGLESTFWVEEEDGLRISSVITNASDVWFENNGTVTFKTDGGHEGSAYHDIVITDGNATNLIRVNFLTGGISVE